MKNRLLDFLPFVFIISCHLPLSAAPEWKTVEISGGPWRITHRHDPASPQMARLAGDPGTHAQFFSEQNTFSRLVIGMTNDASERNGETARPEIPCPPLTRLWLSSDNDILVGLSDIDRNNPWQIAIWNLATMPPRLIRAEHVPDRISRLTRRELVRFRNRYPDAWHVLESRVGDNAWDEAVGIDYTAPGMAKTLGEEAVRFLENHDTPSPHVTNIARLSDGRLRWFHPVDPGIRLRFFPNRNEGKTVSVTLRDPQGIPVTFAHIPLDPVESGAIPETRNYLEYRHGTDRDLLPSIQPTDDDILFYRERNLVARRGGFIPADALADKETQRNLRNTLGLRHDKPLDFFQPTGAQIDTALVLATHFFNVVPELYRHNLYKYVAQAIGIEWKGRRYVLLNFVPEKTPDLGKRAWLPGPDRWNDPTPSVQMLYDMEAHANIRLSEYHPYVSMD
ncbi:hypothetical protein OPIT5_11225 [Opitutaceae bacterium TAV5]|nr:hypothetical protein OPIT5_11225 [Opitutaceae bacterium TAV5]